MTKCGPNADVYNPGVYQNHGKNLSPILLTMTRIDWERALSKTFAWRERGFFVPAECHRGGLCSWCWTCIELDDRRSLAGQRRYSWRWICCVGSHHASLRHLVNSSKDWHRMKPSASKSGCVFTCFYNFTMFHSPNEVLNFLNSGCSGFSGWLSSLTSTSHRLLRFLGPFDSGAWATHCSSW